MMTKTTKRLPVDDAKADEHTFSDADYDAATDGARALRERVMADRLAKAAYDRATTEIELHQMSLAKLRKARRLAQAAVAELMDMQQSEVSRLERRSDLLLSTMRKFIEATGGELVMVARYPEGDVEVVTPGEPI